MNMGVTLNFDASTVAPTAPMDPVPSGWYNAKITESSLEPTSKPGGQMLKLTMEIIDGQYVGRKVFDRLNLVNENPVAVEIAFKTLSAIQHAVGVIQCANSQQLHGIPLKVKVKLKSAERGADGKDYDAGNEVRGYDSINSDHSTVAAAGIVPGVAGAPGGQPAWAVGAAAAAPAPPAAAPPAPAYQPPGQPMQAPTAVQPWQQAANAAPPPQAAPPPPVQAPPPPQVATATGPVMLPAANGIPYESYRSSGWSDEALIQNGMMAAPAAPGQPSAAPIAAAGPASATPPWAR